MPATLRLREASDETAELQDLLSRLLTPEVGGEIGGGWWDGWNRTVNYLHGINCKNILVICNLIVKAQDSSQTKLIEQTQVTLNDFIRQLGTQQEKTEAEEKARIAKLGGIWGILKAELQMYVGSDRTRLAIDAKPTVSAIRNLLEKMTKFEKGWSDEFKRN